MSNIFHITEASAGVCNFLSVTFLRSLRRFLKYITSFTEPHNLQQLEFRYQMINTISPAFAEYYHRILPQNIISFVVYFGDNTSRTPVG